MSRKRSEGVEANELGNDPIDQEPGFDGVTTQPEDTRGAKAEADTASREAASEAARASHVEANAPDQDTGPEVGQPQPLLGEVELPLGLSVEDIVWWNRTENRNYMAGDGPQAGITEGDGSAQSASSVVPEVRAETLEESRKTETSKSEEEPEG